MYKGGQEEVYNFMVKYGGPFSLRGEKGTYPSIEEDLQVIENSLLFIRPFHVRLVHLGILKQDMSPSSSPIMLIARRNSILKRIITD